MGIRPRNLNHWIQHRSRWYWWTQIQLFQRHQWWRICLVMWNGIEHLIRRSWIINLWIPYHHHLIQSLWKHLKRHRCQKWSHWRMLWKWIKHCYWIKLLWRFHLWWLFTRWISRCQKIRHLCWTLYRLSRIRLLLLTRIIFEIRSFLPRYHRYWWNLSRKIYLPILI